MRNPEIISGKAEYGTCKNCKVAIIRWPNRPPEYASPSDKIWIHNPPKGFRLRKCTPYTDDIAEPEYE